jgi:hypothetical protein
MVDGSMGLHSTNTISTLSGWASSVVPPPRSTKCGLANFGTSPPTDRQGLESEGHTRQSTLWTQSQLYQALWKHHNVLAAGIGTTLHSSEREDDSLPLLTHSQVALSNTYCLSGNGKLLHCMQYLTPVISQWRANHQLLSSKSRRERLSPWNTQ